MANRVGLAKALAAMREKVGANAYYIDLASVDAIPEGALRFKTGEQEPLKSAERRMASALAAMPLVPDVYRDIGNIYFAAVDTRASIWAACILPAVRACERNALPQ